MTLTIHNDLEQGSPEWLKARLGMMTCSELNLVLTPTLKKSDNAKLRSHAYELAAQRITQHVEPTFITDAMLRGHLHEEKARNLYSDRVEPVMQQGFYVREFEGFSLGYSPDGKGLFGPFGIEIKSRNQKFQVEVAVTRVVPTEHILQCQGGLLVTGWDYIDYVSYSSGMHMQIIRVEPDEKYQSAIKEACAEFEERVQDIVTLYQERLADMPVVIETERDDDAQEVF